MVGVLEEEIKSSNEFYFFKHENKRPFVTIKIAQTMDNYAADINGKPIFREDGKILKGENYFKPNIKEILDDY